MTMDASQSQEIATLQQTIHAFSGQLRARKQCMDELFDANVNLRSSNILLEDQLKKLQDSIQMFTDRTHDLEKKIAELQNKLDDAKLDEMLPDVAPVSLTGL